MARTTGQVSWFSEDRGFGFITPDGGNTDCFVHQSQIQPDDVNALAVGDRVEFEPVTSTKGPAAHHVVKLPGRRSGAAPSP
jgi:CspA family cold shock protein